MRKKIPNWLKKLRLPSNLCFLSAILAAPDAAHIELGEAKCLKETSKIDQIGMCQSWQISRWRDERANSGDIRNLRAKRELRDSGLFNADATTDKILLFNSCNQLLATHAGVPQNLGCHRM